ncbi:hypothetical protein [Bradyrhizobium canariense]|uniref:Uncharacterized protein n=1 Tax=Bradyrhizobium canariense TaxID=255045 RepID=A0A1H1PNM2_9BRAD|nr:hypothetical protein [Bradyrhizobium canariense]SDS12694.1 hypothetical protein SAMN05444158_1093 [Bradyrhizobium canariense]
MDKRISFFTISSAVCVAAYVAILLDYIARDDLGFSRSQIRGVAVIAAVLIGSIVAIGFFGKKLGKAK